MSCIVDAFREDQENASLQADAPSVHLLRPQEAKKWDEFVSTCPEATFFQRVFGHRTWFLYAELNGEIQGVLPLAEVKSHLFGHSLSSLPFCVYGGIAAISEPGREVLDQAAQTLASQLRVDYLEYRNLKMRHSDWPTKDLYATFRKEISPEIEQNMREIPRKQRAMVRKGIKFGLESVVDEGIERFFSAYSASLHRLGTPVFSKKYFRILKEVFADDCELMIIVKEGRTISGVMSFYFRDEVLPRLAATCTAGSCAATSRR